MRRLCFFTLILLLAWSGAARAEDTAKKNLDTMAQSLIQNNYTTGIIAALIRGDRTETFSYGKVSRDSKKAPDETTIFEIGSVTKTFTARTKRWYARGYAENTTCRIIHPVLSLFPRCQ